MTVSVALFWKLDRVFIQPRLKHIPQDWLRLETGMAISLAGHVLGALLALFACGRIFGFEIEATTPWFAVGGMMVGFSIIHGGETALRYYRQLKEKERQEEQLRTLATQAELRALKAQINPHFLFNTLNTIAALIHTNPELAEATVERLAELFRYVLTTSERGKVLLEEELSFLNGYLEIERARFGERLRVTRKVAPETLSVPVPSLILQPLVENAIKHGRSDDGSINLTIRAERDGDTVLIAITDQGAGIPDDYQIGNVSQRVVNLILGTAHLSNAWNGIVDNRAD